MAPDPDKLHQQLDALVRVCSIQNNCSIADVLNPAIAILVEWRDNPEGELATRYNSGLRERPI